MWAFLVPEVALIKAISAAERPVLGARRLRAPMALAIAGKLDGGNSSRASVSPTWCRRTPGRASSLATIRGRSVNTARVSGSWVSIWPVRPGIRGQPSRSVVTRCRPGSARRRSAERCCSSVVVGGEVPPVWYRSISLLLLSPFGAHSDGIVFDVSLVGALVRNRRVGSATLR
jgi:hypothetical protein